jgi:hypothetical protein
MNGFMSILGRNTYFALIINVTYECMIMFLVNLDLFMSYGQNEFLYVHFISGSSKRNDNNHFEMWIASLVVACVSCMCNVSFVKINKNLDGIFDHIASQSMHNWDSHQLSMIILLGLKPCIRFLGKGNTSYSNFSHVQKKNFVFPNPNCTDVN